MKITKIKQAEKKNFLQRCRTYFLTGIAVTAPIGITIYISIIFINFIDRNVKDLFHQLTTLIVTYLSIFLVQV